MGIAEHIILVLNTSMPIQGKKGVCWRKRKLQEAPGEDLPAEKEPSEMQLSFGEEVFKGFSSS